MSEWLRCPRPSPSAAVHLFCFPYAGGAAAAFSAWPSRLLPNVELHAVELPGRGSRIKEPCIAEMRLLVPQLAEVICANASRPFVLFGHSLGAVIAFEVTRELRRTSNPLPTRLLLSAASAPDMRKHSVPVNNLSDDQLIVQMREFGGTPLELEESKELMALMLPVLRADFSLSDSYRWETEAPLDVDISVFGGVSDPFVSYEALSAWRSHTAGSFRMARLPGDHFFIHSARNEFLSLLLRECDVAARRQL